MPAQAISPRELERFQAWLLDMGRAEGTVAVYSSNLRQCAAADPEKLTSRLVDSDLAPKSLHTNRAALEAWAEFTEDADLTRRLRRIKLPPARRARPKVPLERGDWRTLVAGIEAAKISDVARAVLLIMARRGLRSGDVLRLKKREVCEAVGRGDLSYEAKGRRRIELAAAPIFGPLEVLAKQKGDWHRVEDLLLSGRCRSTGYARRKAASMCVRRALLKVAESLEMTGVHPHRLRRSYATFFLAELRGDPQALIKLQQHMGWDSLSTAAGYVDATDRAELDAISVRLNKDLR